MKSEGILRSVFWGFFFSQKINFMEEVICFSVHGYVELSKGLKQVPLSVKDFYFIS